MTKAVEINFATGQRVERDLSAEEIAEREAISSARIAEAEAKAAAKASAVAKLQELGLTVEEVSAAFGLEAE